MQELIQIQPRKFNETEVNSVNARELWEFLGSKREFSTWIKQRIEKYEFLENIDFIVIDGFVNDDTSFSGTRKIIEYYISLDMAKELAMVENNIKGKEIRKYFIEVEKKYKQLEKPKTEIETIELLIKHAQELVQTKKELEKANQTILIQDKEIIESKPKVEFFNAVTESKDAIDIGTVAKVLNFRNNNNKVLGRNQLFEILRNESILMNNNQPYQKFIDNGFFRIIEQKYSKPDGSNHINIKTVVYQKGVDYILNLLKDKYYDYSE